MALNSDDGHLGLFPNLMMLSDSKPTIVKRRPYSFFQHKIAEKKQIIFKFQTEINKIKSSILQQSLTLYFFKCFFFLLLLLHAVTFFPTLTACMAVHAIHLLSPSNLAEGSPVTVTGCFNIQKHQDSGIIIF